MPKARKITKEKEMQREETLYGKLCEALKEWTRNNTNALVDLETLDVEDSIKEAILCWIRVLEQEGKQVPETRGWMFTALTHSSLIHWLLLGNEPLPKPPPKYMSRPWHQLIVDGRGWVGEVWEFPKQEGESEANIVIGQDSSWKLRENLGNGAYLVSFYGSDKWVVVPAPEEKPFQEHVLFCLNPKVLKKGDE